MSRFKFSFWLNCKNDDELIVAETVDELKRNRSFSAVVRDGIMIVNELREGRVDLLLKLFPFVKDAIMELYPPPQPPPTDDITDLKRMFERFMEQQGRALPDTRDGGFPAMMPANQAAKAPPIAAVTTAKAASADEIADAFLAFLQ